MEGEGEFAEYSAVGHAWNRGGSLSKSLEEGGHSKRDVAATGTLASRIKGGRGRGWSIVMVRNKALVLFRGVCAGWLGLEELEERVFGGPCQEAFSHARRTGKSRS